MSLLLLQVVTVGVMLLLRLRGKLLHELVVC